MSSYPLPINEEERLAILRRYGILDTPPEETFDHIVDLASELFDVPIALVSLVDRHRQFFKAKIGVDVCETSRDVSFCAHALMEEEVFIVPDALADPRFKDNALVTSEPNIRFYAGAPLITRDNYKIGTLCIIDSRPGLRFSIKEATLLQNLARICMDALELRKLHREHQASLKLAAATPVPFVCFSSDGYITFWNSAAERTFGYERNEILGRSIDEIIPSLKETFAFRKGDNRIHSRGRAVCTQGFRKDNTSFLVEVSLSFWRDNDHRVFGAAMTEVHTPAISPASSLQIFAKENI